MQCYNLLFSGAMEKDKVKLLPWLPEGAFGGQPQTPLRHFCPVFLLPLRGSSMSRAKSNNLYSLAPWYCTYSPPTVQRGSFSKNQSKREMLSPFSIGNTSSKGPLSIAMLDYWSVKYLRKHQSPKFQIYFRVKFKVFPVLQVQRDTFPNAKHHTPLHFHHLNEPNPRPPPPPCL